MHGGYADLLAQRRAAVQGQRRERDAMAIALLQFEIESIDREIAKLQPAVAL